MGRSRLLVCHDFGGGYFADRHCFGLSCPWGEGGTKERERGEAEAEVPAAAVGRAQMEKEEEEEGKGIKGKEKGGSEHGAEGLEDKVALATVAFLPPASLPPSLAPAFRLLAFDLCDTFIYFSHHLVFFPPSSWISLCHRQGVRCLRTFITEWAGRREARVWWTWPGITVSTDGS